MVTVWRWEAEVGSGLAASFGVRVARFATVGARGSWREEAIGAVLVVVVMEEVEDEERS